jgi:hypothetical protein
VPPPRARTSSIAAATSASLIQVVSAGESWVVSPEVERSNRRRERAAFLIVGQLTLTPAELRERQVRHPARPPAP